MVTYRDVKHFDPAIMREFGLAMGRVSSTFVEANSQVHHGIVTDLRDKALKGHAITAASARAGEFSEQVGAGGKEATSLQTAADEFSSGIERVQRDLADVEDEARNTPNLELTADGRVVYHRPTAVPNDGPASDAEAEVTDDGLAKAKQGEADRLDGAIRALVEQATAYDLEFGSQLRLIAELTESVSGPQDVSFNPDAANDIAAARREAMPEDRHAANMNALRADINSGNNPEEARRILEAIEYSRKYEGMVTPLYLLGYDNPPNGSLSDARVAVSIGNPDTADNTSIYVPGTGTDAGSFFDSSDKFGREMSRAYSLYTEAGAMAPDKSVASIVWLDYDNPQDAVEASRDERAVDGGERLDRFVNGLNAAHQGPDTHVTAIGHSYGSTVIGQADVQDNGLAVDDVVFLGSPGLGPESGVAFADNNPLQDTVLSDTVDGVSDMHRPADHVWSAAAGDDWIGWSEAHGTDPTEADFGGRRMSTDTSGHSAYWEEGSQSLRNQAAVIAGEYNKVEQLPPREDQGMVMGPDGEPGPLFYDLVKWLS